MIRKVSRGLLQKGVKQGDRVCVHSRNDIYYDPVVLSIIAAGAVGVPIPASYSAHEAADAPKESSSSWIFADPEISAAEAASVAGLDKSHIIGSIRGTILEAIQTPPFCLSSSMGRQHAHQSIRKLLPCCCPQVGQRESQSLPQSRTPILSPSRF